MKLSDLKAQVAACRGDAGDDIIVTLGGVRYKLYAIQMTPNGKDDEVVVKLQVVRDL